MYALDMYVCGVYIYVNSLLTNNLFTKIINL